MFTLKYLFSLFIAIFSCISVLSQEAICRITSWHETSNNEPIHHIQGILQDKNGMIWITSWSGVYSFDGIEFMPQHKHENIDSKYHQIHSRGLDICPEGEKWHIATSDKEIQITDKFGTTWHMHANGQLFYSTNGEAEKIYPAMDRFKDYRGCFIDQQGNLWVMCLHSLHKIVFTKKKLQNSPYINNDKAIRCMHRFHNGHIWLCQHRGNRIVVLDENGKQLGYLNTQGKISPKACEFAANIYCITEAENGDIWMGSRGKGLFCLRAKTNGNFELEHCLKDEQGEISIYDMVYDRHGRLWLASLEQGLLCLLDNPESQGVQIQKIASYNYQEFPRAHQLYRLEDTLFVATSQGLVVADISNPDTDATTFNYHTHRKDNPKSLSSSICNDVMVDSRGQLLVCSENAGLNICTSASFMDKELTFEHPSNIGLPDITLSISENEGDIWMTSLYSISRLQFSKNGSAQCFTFGSEYLGERMQFMEETPPLKLNENQWIIATKNGVRILNEQDLNLSEFQPKICLTSIDIPQDRYYRYSQTPDTLVILPKHRSFKLNFASLDYLAPEDIHYAYRIKDLDTCWISLKNRASISFANIAPGEHLLEIKSTNSDGIWCNNIYQLPIWVKKKFSESIWAIILLILFILGLFGSTIYVVYYIRTIRRNHNEVQAAFLSIIGKQESSQRLIEKSIHLDDEGENFIQKLTEYINENLSNTDLSVESMAQHMALSYSTMIRHTKSYMGITPGEFLAKARIRKACILLSKQKYLSISEVAYRCGFNDPRYFARCFKSEMNMSPSEYKNRHLQEEMTADDK